MNQSRNLVMAILLLLSAASPFSAQNTVVYQCDFEQLADRDAWTRNKFYNPAYAVDLYNKWYIGKPGNFGPQGQYGLYISSYNPQQPDSSKAEYQAPSASYTVAYCDVPTLTVGTTYTLQFDYRVLGDAINAMLQVWWLPQSFTQLTCANGNFTNTRWVNNGGKQLGATLSGKSSWDSFTATLTVNSTQASGRLVFLWECYKSTPNQPSACVDNIVLFKDSLCASAPSNIMYTHSTGTLTWSGDSTTEYDVMFYNTKTETIEYSTTVMGNTTSYVPMEEGAYTIYVRSHCGGDMYSPWGTETLFIWIAGRRCFDYMDLENTKICHCFTGDATSSSYDAYKTPGAPISWTYGYWETGRHTLHTDTLMTDPNTGNRLYVIPRDDDHETMSVRLGNAQYGSEAEGIVYTMHIPKGESRILKLKYALVQENGGHDAGGAESGPHSGNEQSHFYVEIRDQWGHPQGEGCTTFNFSCPSDISQAPDDSFHEAPGGIFWKDWTTVYISLIEYEGQTITIRLGNYDCTASGHFGYAYFTMGCIDGTLSNHPSDSVGYNLIIAPYGFDYRWYWEGDPDADLSYNQDFYIGSTNDSTYRVECINRETGCYFTLVANKKIVEVDSCYLDSMQLTWMPMDLTTEYVLRIYSNQIGLDTTLHIAADPNGGIRLPATSILQRGHLIGLDDIGSVVIITIDPNSGSTITDPFVVTVYTTSEDEILCTYNLRVYQGPFLIREDIGTFTLNYTPSASGTNTIISTSFVSSFCYDLYGRRYAIEDWHSLPTGIYILHEGGETKKMIKQ